MILSTINYVQKKFSNTISNCKLCINLLLQLCKFDAYLFIQIWLCGFFFLTHKEQKTLKLRLRSTEVTYLPQNFYRNSLCIEEAGRLYQTQVVRSANIYYILCFMISSLFFLIKMTYMQNVCSRFFLRFFYVHIPTLYKFKLNKCF